MTTPAGWYPDPEQTSSSGDSRTLRWWDGSTWTDHRTEQEGAPAQAATGWGAAPAAGSAPASSGSYGGWSAAPSVAGQGSWSGGKATATPSGELLAGLGSRLVAKLIDGVILTIVGGLLASPFIVALFRISLDYVDQVAADPSGEAATDPFILYRDPEYLGNYALVLLISGVVGALYEILFIRLKGATPGKMAMGLRVRRWDAPPADGVGWGRSAGRWAVAALPGSVVPLWGLLDVLWCCWDGRKQTLHDKIVGTVVVSTRR